MLERLGIVEEGAHRRAAHPQHIYIPPYDRIRRPPAPAMQPAPAARSAAPAARSAAPGRATAVMVRFCEAYTEAAGNPYTLPHLTGERRDRFSAAPRHVCMLLVRDICHISTPSIGKLFGGRNHTTVLSGLRRAPHWMAADPALKQAHDRVLASFSAELQSEAA